MLCYILALLIWTALIAAVLSQCTVDGLQEYHWHLLLSLLTTGFFWDTDDFLLLLANMLLATKAGLSHSRSTYCGVQTADASLKSWETQVPCLPAFAPQEIWERGKMLLLIHCAILTFLSLVVQRWARVSGPQQVHILWGNKIPVSVSCRNIFWGKKK